jgi:hypothetical protein
MMFLKFFSMFLVILLFLQLYLVIFYIFIFLLILLNNSTLLSCSFAPFIVFCVPKPKVVKLNIQSFINFFFK